MRTLLGLVTVALLAAGCSGPADRRSAPTGAEPPATPSSSTPPGPEPERVRSSGAPEKKRGADPGPAGFTARVSPITPALRERMSASHRPGCPVPLDRLRHLTLSYVGFDGRSRTGELVVAARHADDVVSVFERLYDARFPIQRMRLVDAYGADDARSMAANNTSAYNCRRVAGTDRWSEHAYGGAIDLNPVQNPYVQGAAFVPAEGAAYVDVPRGRGARAEPGVVVAGDVVDRAFASVGWEWGGRWRSSKDYQHFSASGG
ncbi:M15 family metallopeptidase [Nocardioides sp. HDW12B]|uniref:M15 family metallopeptidase n=1 Tax=Nocardioides sp. HDW12B TaxID=2714939 RepID=UPI00140B6EDB|nr:M15 family metallopeptidase [Nocardioides sp. HDW12B]QIK66161.1 M15 family metallopeptidase [Nocardioides sp. HDW12B]